MISITIKAVFIKDQPLPNIWEDMPLNLWVMVSKMELNIGKSKTHGVKDGEIMVLSKCLEELINVTLNQEELQEEYGDHYFIFKLN